MKKFLIFIIIVSAGAGIFYYQQTSTCNDPLAYDIGSLDTRFGISKEKLLKTIKESEGIWEKNTGKNLFDYQAGGKLKINLVFDERQATTVQAKQSEQQITTSRASYDILLQQYKSLESSYKSSLSSYDYRVNQLAQELDSYNIRVAEANKKGGATPQEYQSLEKERQYIQTQKAELDNERLTLNEKAAELNALGDRVNELAKEFNIEIDIHNQRFGEAKEFDQGDYINNRINIYQFNGFSDLRLVLAHELGHALGLSHVENPKSIMYYLMDKQDLNNPVLSKEDREALLKRCTFHIPKLNELFNFQGAF